MKKMVTLMMALLLAVAAPLIAFAEDTEMITRLEGLVTEVIEGGFLMEDIQLGEVMVNTDENSVMDGLLAQEELAVGMYVFVDFNGMMTRSVPAQVYAQRVGCYTLNGVASQITEEGILLTGDPIYGEVLDDLEQTHTPVFLGAPVQVYYDGVITMSLPGQVTAHHVVVPELTGVVSETDGAGFTLIDADGNTYRILTSDVLEVGELTEAVEEDETLVMDGEEVVADETDEDGVVEEPAEPVQEEPAEEAAQADEPAEAEMAVEAEETVTDEEEPAEETLPAIQWVDGDLVTVYHQGPVDAQPGSDLIALGLLIHR